MNFYFGLLRKYANVQRTAQKPIIILKNSLIVSKKTLMKLAVEKKEIIACTALIRNIIYFLQSHIYTLIITFNVVCIFLFFNLDKKHFSNALQHIFCGNS